MKRIPATLARRDFLKTAAGAGAGLLILPGRSFAAEGAPSNKLNIALLGAYGRARAHYETLKNENVTVICDVDQNHLDIAQKEFPNAKRYADWREALEHKDLDAVLCCTPDSVHSFISLAAMKKGLHVYMEKPLGLSVEEVRRVRETFVKNKGKLATQMGTQRHAMENFDRVRELIKQGAIGELKDVHVWGNRTHNKTGYLPAEGKPPPTLNWELWLGPSPDHPYNPGYFGANPGANCLNWNPYWDFGSWQVGDMGSHTMDLAWNALDAGLVTSATAEGDPYSPEVAPSKLKCVFDVPANGWRGPIRVAWYQGGAMPNPPSKRVDLNLIDHGAMFKGDQGVLVAGFDYRMLIPMGKGADMTYFKTPTKEQVAPPIGNFQEQWTKACKGDKKTSCDFEYSGTYLEMMFLGLVAHRVGSKLEYDPVKGQITNNPAAQEFLKKKYRDGWKLPA